MEAIIFDYGGVLCFHPTAAQIEDVADLLGVSREQFLEAYWKFRIPYDRGDLDGPAYWKKVAESLGHEYTREQIREFMQRDIEFWLSMDSRMLKWVRELRTVGIKLGLISNLPVDLGNYLRTETKLFDLFDHVTLSYQQRVVKPDAAIYHDCVAGLAVEAAEALFLDDREPNVRGAEDAGLKGLVFETPEQLAGLLAGEAHDLVPFGAPPVDLG
jgi:putative hydrolase of the HAD superfamily